MAAPILSLFEDGLMAYIFSFVGPSGTARCSLCCKHFQRVSYTTCSRTLWRSFTLCTFAIPSTNTDTTHTDWRAVYAYLAEKAQQTANLQEARVVFSDDGSPVPNYPPENAIAVQGRAWCTNSDVDEDVDLVIAFPEMMLLSGFAARNGGRFYSAPLKEALVFCSTQPIDLDDARRYNGERGTNFIQQYEEANRGRDYRQNTFRYQPIPRLQLVSVPTVISTPPRQPSEPVAAFWFSPLPVGYGQRLERRCPPTVARYVHFKLLSSRKTPNVLSTNIDVMDLHSFGVPLPELPALLQAPQLAMPPPDPSYPRQHAIRVYPFW